MQDRFGRTISENSDGFFMAGMELTGVSSSQALAIFNAHAPEGWAEPVLIPSVSKAQILIWLLQNLKKTEADVQSALETIKDQDERSVAIIRWTYPEGRFERSSPLFDQLGALFGLKPAQVDTAFIEGSQL